MDGDRYYGGASPLPAENSNEAKNKNNDKNDEEEKNSGRVNGIRYYGAAIFLFGIGTIGVSIPLFTAWEDYSNVKSPLEETGSDFAFQLNLPILILVTGIVLMFSGALGVVAYSKNSKKLGYAAITVTLIAAAVQIYASVTIKVTLDNLKTKLEGNPVTSDFTAAEKSVMDFTGAVFNTCCLPVYDSRNYTFGDFFHVQLIRDGQPLDDNQRPIRQCGSDVPSTCPLTGPDKMFPDIIAQVANLAGTSLTDVLCHCYSTQEAFDKYINIIERDGLCEKYRNIIATDADDQEVPTTGLTFGKLIGLLNLIRPEYADNLPIGEFAMVGKILPPKSLYGEPAEKIGWSCGLGYAKADAYYMYLFIDQHTKVVVIGSLALAALSAVLSALLGLFWCTGGGNSEEELMEYGQEYEYSDPYKEKKEISV